MVDVINDPDCRRAGRHRKLVKAEVKNGEESVQRVLAAVMNFTNPLTIGDKKRLLVAGAPVPTEVEMDVPRAEALG